MRCFVVIPIYKMGDVVLSYRYGEYFHDDVRGESGDSLDDTVVGEGCEFVNKTVSVFMDGENAPPYSQQFASFSQMEEALGVVTVFVDDE